MVAGERRGKGVKTTEKNTMAPISRKFCWGRGGGGGVTRVDRVNKSERGWAGHAPSASWAENSIINEKGKKVAVASLGVFSSQW